MYLILKNKQRLIRLTTLLVGVTMLGFSLPNAWAGTDSLQVAVKQGEHIFTTETFGGRGITCQSCHMAGGRTMGEAPNGIKIPSLTNAAAIFPRFNPKTQRVVTLQNQIEACIAGAIGGQPIKNGGLQMTDLVSYLTSLAHGQRINMGGKPK